MQLSQRVHPYYHCPKRNNKKDKDDKYKSSKEIKSIIKNLSKDTKKAKKTFTILQDKITEIKEDK